MRQMKAISPIIAIIVILLITIAIAGSAYSYISVYWTSITGKEIQVIDTYCYSGNHGKVVVKNIGTSVLHTNEITVIDAGTNQGINQDVLWVEPSIGSGLVLELKFEEGSGTTAFDTSSQGSNGTLVGNPQWVDGKIGGALQFSPVTDYVTLSQLDSFKAISLWANIQGGSLLTHDTSWSSNDDYYLFYSGGNIGFSKNDASGLIDAPIDLNKWVHITVLCANGINTMLYLNGELADQSGAAAVSDCGTPLILGRDHIGTISFDGIIDDVRAYDRVLSEDEIKSLAGSFSIEPGETATINSHCTGMCRYNLLVGTIAKETMLQC